MVYKLELSYSKNELEPESERLSLYSPYFLNIIKLKNKK
jgi:hypothetical protein